MEPSRIFQKFASLFMALFGYSINLVKELVDILELAIN